MVSDTQAVSHGGFPAARGLCQDLGVGSSSTPSTQQPFTVEIPLLSFTVSAYWGAVEEYCISCWGTAQQRGLRLGSTLLVLAHT